MHLTRLLVSALLLVGLALSQAALAQTPTAGSATLFRSVRIFDGKSGAISGPADVLVSGNVIARISVDAIEADAGATVIDGSGRTLMPGLIDAHTHLTFSTIPLAVMFSADPNYSMLRSGRAAGEMLMRGFTTARDMGGPVFGLKRAIDEGFIPGPRIWPAGAAISQTSGHGDYRTLHDLPWAPGDAPHFTERMGAARIADGADAVLRATREQLMLGASHIKLMAGGGVSSNYDPLDVTQYTAAELRAAVDAAANWGTYVAVHAYTPAAMQQAIRAGVKCIEHGQLVDEATAKLMAETGTWWSLQPFLDDEDATPFPEGSPNRQKQSLMFSGTDHAYALAKRFGIRTAFGTDTLFDPGIADRQGAQLAKLTRWYSPGEVLKMATGDNGALLALSGLRSPYPGKLGVVEEGALADLLLVDGDPVADIGLVADPENSFLVIMKDGKVYKNLAE